MSNYLALESLVIARLKATLPEINNQVQGAADLEGVKADQQVAPRIDVVPYGEGVLQGEKDGSRVGNVQICEPRILVVVVVRNVRDIRSGAATRSEAGELLWEANAALQGWKPDADHGHLKKIPAPAPAYDRGFGYYPLAFASRIVRKGALQP